jgi:hypothetical protein
MLAGRKNTSKTNRFVDLTAPISLASDLHNDQQAREPAVPFS